MSKARPMNFFERASLYLGRRIDYFTWQSHHHRLTAAQWRRLQHKGRSPRGTAAYYQHAPGKGRPTPRRPRRG